MKEKALRRMAEKLNAAGVTWAVGASWLLYRKGIVDTFHDFDLLVAGEDAGRADAILTGLGMKTPSAPKPGYATAVFCEYHFDGADIDLMSGFAVERDGQVWHARFDASSVAQTVSVLGAQVPVMYLEDWFVLYSLMGRESRADAIAAYFAREGVAHPERFGLVLKEPLPDALQARIRALTEEKQA